MATLADEADEGPWDQQSYCSCMNSKLSENSGTFLYSRDKGRKNLMSRPAWTR